MTNQTKHKLQRFINHILRNEHINFKVDLMFSRSFSNEEAYGMSLFGEEDNDIVFPYNKLVLVKSKLKDMKWSSKLTALHELAHIISVLKHPLKYGESIDHDKDWADTYRALSEKYLVEQMGEVSYDIYENTGYYDEDMEELKVEADTYYSTKHYMANRMCDRHQKMSMRSTKKHFKMLTKLDISKKKWYNIYSGTGLFFK